MAANDYLDFNFDDLPNAFSHDIDGNTYNFMLYYNDTNDSFYIDIYDNSKPQVPLIMGEKLVYGMPLFGGINDPRLPAIQIVPIDDDGNESIVNRSNFPDIIKLEFIDTDLDNDDTDDDDDNVDINTPNYADTLSDDTNLYGNDQVRGGN